MIGTPEIIYIATITAGSIIYAAYMRKPAETTAPPSPPQFNKNEKNKLKEIEEKQTALNGKVENLTGKVQDMQIALRLKPDEKPTEEKTNEPV